ncbi:hypothetical protein E2C01_096261 [Portunus trituberculatus]|uniref:Uncharacterized protein n=1 Tax=Portunus trituberculatus TaxID=210409 RepID=A0A5B7JXH9_PORTR|nr:hypothetical protein [Portunus trituberculatus]
MSQVCLDVASFPHRRAGRGGKGGREGAVCDGEWAWVPNSAADGLTKEQQKPTGDNLAAATVFTAAIVRGSRSRPGHLTLLPTFPELVERGEAGRVRAVGGRLAVA